MYQKKQSIFSIYLFIMSLFFSLAWGEGGSNTPTITITPASQTVVEGNSGQRTLTFTVTADTCPNKDPIKIKVVTSNGSAQSGQDYVPLNHPITFNNTLNCQKVYTVTVRTKGDTAVENDETFFLTIQDHGTDTAKQGYNTGNSATVTIQNDDVSHDADLRVGKSNNRPHPNIGEQVIYTIRGINAGPENSQIYINDTLPADLDYVSVSDDSSNFNCHYNPGTRKVVCQGSRDFSANEDVFVTLTTTLNSNQHSEVDNTAHISSNNGIHDNNTNNNSSTSPIYPNTYDARVNKRIQRTNGNWSTSRTANTGDTIKYRINVYNNRAQPTTLNLTDTLPSGVTLQSVSVSGVPNYSCSANIGQNKITCNGSYIFRDIHNFSGDKATILITALATQSGRYYNRARVTGDSTIRGTDRWSNKVRLDTDLTGEYLSRDKTVTAPTNPDGNYYVNDTVTFTLSGVNHGSDGKVRILDWLPPTGTGLRNGTTRSAFDYISVTNGAGAPMQCTFKTSTNTNYNYIKCTSNNALPDNAPFSANVTVRLKKAGHVCNRAYFYKKYELSGTSTFFYGGYDQVCFDVLTPKQPPVLNIPDMSRTVDTFMGINLQSYTTDLDTPKANLIYTVTGLPPGLSMTTHGIISGTYTGAIGTYDINVTVTDEVGLSDSDVFTLTFVYPPIQANDNVYEIPIGTSLTGNLITESTTSSGTTYQPDIGHNLQVTGINYISGYPGTLDTWGANGDFNYTAPLSMPNASGDDILAIYTVTDKYNQTAQANLHIQVYLPPIEAKDDSYEILTNATKTGNVLLDNAGNGPDIGINLSVISHTEPLHGTLTLNADGNFTYTPDEDFTGTDSFTYTIQDISMQEDNATVTFTIGDIFSSGYADFYLVNPLRTRNIIGDFLVTGNTVECVTSNEGNETNPYDGACSNSTNDFNNNHIVKYIDIDGNSSIGAQTWNSSSASFTLPSGFIPDNSKGILWAALYWQGSVNNRKEVSDPNVQRRAGTAYGSPYGYKEINSVESLDMNATDAPNVLIRIDDSTSYKNVHANSFYYDLAHTVSSVHAGGYYAAYTDVTQLLQDENLTAGEHNITVANITTNEGRESNIGNYGGWSLVVIYREDFTSGALRNISIYNGYQPLGKGANTYVTEKEFTISGFRLPQSAPVKSQIGFFVGEGEQFYGGHTNIYDEIYIQNTSRTLGGIIDGNNTNIFDGALTDINRTNGDNNDILNTNGIDIDHFDISDIMTTIRDDSPTVSSIILGVTSKDETATGGLAGDQSDYVTLSMLAFSAQLYRPKLCYNYNYKQNGITFTEDNNGSAYPTIKNDHLFGSTPITVELYVQNEEASDAILRDVTLDIYDIDSSQGTYIPESVYVTYPQNILKQHIPDSSLSIGTAPDSVNNIPLQDINSLDYIYTYYDIDPKSSTIDMPINARLNMTLDLLGSIQYPLPNYPLESLSMCDRNISYLGSDDYGRFNIEDRGLSDPTDNNPHYYDLPTQVVKRVGNYVVRAYDADHPNIDAQTSTMIGIELIDAGKFQDPAVACAQPDNAISPRLWVPFTNLQSGVTDGNTSYFDLTKGNIQLLIDNHMVSDWLLNESNKITDASDYFSKARKNVAFRITFANLDGDVNETHILQLNKHADNTHWDIVNLPAILNLHPNCQRPVKTGASSDTNNSTTACTGTTLPDIARCMECLYGYEKNFICSRDNFAIRPKGYRVAFKDQNQSNSAASPTLISQNNNTNTWNVVADYNYAVEVNATNYIDQQPSEGYYSYFEASQNDANKTFQFSWQTIAGHTTCADTNDYAQDLTLSNGQSEDTNVSNSNIGQYLLTLKDKDYTRVDWDPAKLQHQTGTYFLSGIDCIDGSSLVQTEGIPTSISGINLASVNGCEIASDVSGDSTYTDLKLQFYPYSFDLSGISYKNGASDQWFVYIDTPVALLADDKNMSFNIQGKYFASGYHGLQMSNFTSSCWAENTDMALSFDYLSPTSAPSTTPALSYNIRDYNSTNPSVGYRPLGSINTEPHLNNTSTSPISLTQTKTYYNIEMNGAIAMKMQVNYQRQNNVALNPRKLHFSDLNVTYSTNPTNVYADNISSYAIKGVGAINKDATFVYGRAMPSQTLYDNITDASVITPISVMMYCDPIFANCATAGINTLNSQTSYANWWLNKDHDNLVPTANDGDINLKVTTGAATLSANTVGIDDNGTNAAITVNKNVGAAVPMTVYIDLDAGTDRWLIYNPFHAINWPTPFYRVRFIGQSNWAGHGDTGHVVGGKVNIKQNRRLGW